MGLGQKQAELWGPGARDWSDYNEPMCTPFYDAVLTATGVGSGTRMLDLGCGGGFALLLAASRGANVAGVDVTPALIDVARERVPGAELVVGDIEEPLPFEPGTFDVATAFNSIQFPANPVAVIKHMSQATRSGGLISLLVWGPPEQCESGVIFAELGPLMPPGPPASPGAIVWSEPGQLEQLAAVAGLTPLTVNDVSNPLIYPDLATAVRTQLSSGPAQAAIRHSGLPAARGALDPCVRVQPQAGRDLPAGEHLPIPRRGSVIANPTAATGVSTPRPLALAPATGVPLGTRKT